jgi:ribosomal-protein-alanine N-acetyltransferase
MLRGELTNLRAVERADSELVQRWLDDPELMRWWGYGARALSLASVQDGIEQWLVLERGLGHPVALVIESLPGDAIGLMILSDLQHVDRSAELSCFLDAAYRDRGFGRDALETLIDAAFEQWNYHRLSVRCEVHNERAHAFFEANGFQLEGRLREARFIDGGWSDILVFGRIRTMEGG